MFYNFSRRYGFCSLLFFISVILLVLSGDIETNPGPDAQTTRTVFPFVTGT